MYEVNCVRSHGHPTRLLLAVVVIAGAASPAGRRQEPMEDYQIPFQQRCHGRHQGIHAWADVTDFSCWAFLLYGSLSCFAIVQMACVGYNHAVSVPASALHVKDPAG